MEIIIQGTTVTVTFWYHHVTHRWSIRISGSHLHTGGDQIIHKGDSLCWFSLLGIFIWLPKKVKPNIIYSPQSFFLGFSFWVYVFVCGVSFRKETYPVFSRETLCLCLPWGTILFDNFDILPPNILWVQIRSWFIWCAFGDMLLIIWVSWSACFVYFVL